MTEWEWIELNEMQRPGVEGAQEFQKWFGRLTLENHRKLKEQLKKELLRVDIGEK